MGERRDGSSEGAEERDGLWWFTHTSLLLDMRYKSLGCLKYPIDIKTVTVQTNCELECGEKKVMCTVTQCTVKILASSSIRLNYYVSTDHERSHGTRTKTNLLLTLNVRFDIGKYVGRCAHHTNTIPQSQRNVSNKIIKEDFKSKSS